jgi:hypothetical protein
MIEHLERLPIHYLGHALGDGGDTVVEVHLARRDVDGFIFLMAEAAASRGKSEETQNCKHGQWPQRVHGSSEAAGKRNEENWSSREHSLWRSS